MSKSKISIELTPLELDEVINCITAAYEQHIAYGMISGPTEQCAMINRKRLAEKLMQINVEATGADYSPSSLSVSPPTFVPRIR
jgi:hypothetical protein